MDNEDNKKRVGLFLLDKNVASYGTRTFHALTDRVLYFVPSQNKKNIHSLELTTKNSEGKILNEPSNINLHRDKIFAIENKFNSSDLNPDSSYDYWKVIYSSVKEYEDLIEYISEIPFIDQKDYITSKKAKKFCKLGYNNIDEILLESSEKLTSYSGFGNKTVEQLYSNVFFDNNIRLAKLYNESSKKSLNKKRYYKNYCLFGKYHLGKKLSSMCHYTFTSFIRRGSFNIRDLFTAESIDKLKKIGLQPVTSGNRKYLMRYIAILFHKGTKKRSPFALHSRKFFDKVMKKEYLTKALSNRIFNFVEDFFHVLDNDVKISDTYWRALESKMKK